MGMKSRIARKEAAKQALSPREIAWQGLMAARASRMAKIRPARLEAIKKADARVGVKKHTGRILRNRRPGAKTA